MQTTTWTCWRDATHETTTHPDFGWPRCQVCGAAPPYYERPAYVDDRLELTTYVPVENSPLGKTVAPGSAMVGHSLGERALVYYEGWVHGPAQYADRDARGLWEAGIEHAASRMVTQYPTSAAMTPRTEELTPVGTYRPTTSTVTIADEEALGRWLST